MHKFIIVYVLLNIGLFSFGCSMHRIDIQQGNIVTQEMLDQLELNMPTHKVRFIMGTPLIVDVFHQRRWDYLYSFQAAGGKRQQRKISLFFDENNLLKKIVGNVKLGKQRKPKPTPFPDDFDQEPVL